MKQMRYVGPIGLLKISHNSTALVRPTESSLFVEAQFDGKEDWRLPAENKLKHPDTGAMLCLGWHVFPVAHFAEMDVSQ